MTNIATALDGWTVGAAWVGAFAGLLALGVDWIRHRKAEARLEDARLSVDEPSPSFLRVRFAAHRTGEPLELVVEAVDDDLGIVRRDEIPESPLDELGNPLPLECSNRPRGARSRRIRMRTTSGVAEAEFQIVSLSEGLSPERCDVAVDLIVRARSDGRILARRRAFLAS